MEQMSKEEFLKLYEEDRKKLQDEINAEIAYDLYQALQTCEVIDKPSIARELFKFVR